MTTYIAVVNQKGGVGKSTTTVNTSCALRMLGNKVLAVDADAQMTLTDWKHLVDPPLFPFDTLEMPQATLHKVIPPFAESNGYDYVLIDCPPGGQGRGGKDNISRSAMLLADLVLLPMPPRIADFIAAGRLKTLLNEVATFKPDFTVAVLVNMRKAAGKASKGARSDAAEYFASDLYRLIVLESEVYHREVIAESIGDGVPVQDYKPKTQSARDAVEKATAEYRAVAEELVRCLKPIAAVAH